MKPPEILLHEVDGSETPMHLLSAADIVQLAERVYALGRMQERTNKPIAPMLTLVSRWLGERRSGRRKLPVKGLDRVLGEVARERAAQRAKWGVQNHPDGTGSLDADISMDMLRHHCDTRAEIGTITWVNILAEEVAEAFAETDADKLRNELTQVAAVAVAWIQCIDRRSER